jgi:hypothetical protein
MKIIVCTCAAFFLFGQNLLENPGFESWTGGLPDHWSHDSGIRVFQESGIVYEGYYSARDSLFTQEQTDADLFQGHVIVEPNIRYVVTIRVFDNDPAGQVRQAVYWFPDGSEWSSQYSSDTTTWQEIVLEVLSPPDAESALIVIRAYDIAAHWDGDAVFFLDAVQFQADDHQPPVILRTWHVPVNPEPDTGITVYAWVTDDGSITADTLFFGINGLSVLYDVAHTAVYDDTCVFDIPQQTGGDTVFYFMKFVDDTGATSHSDTGAVYIGTVDVSVNEIFYDASGIDTACYIELFKPGGGPLEGYSLVGVSGSSGSDYSTIDLDGCTVPPDGFFVIAQDSTVPNFDLVAADANMQNGPDNVELRYYDITVDALGYGDLDGWYFTGEWLPACDVTSGHGLGRYPDGHDTDDNADDFHDYTSLTPGAPNPFFAVEETADALLPACSRGGCFVSGIACAEIVPDECLYPILAYNILGQQVLRITHPGRHISLAAGVYFFRLHRAGSVPMKIVVVK